MPPERLRVLLAKAAQLLRARQLNRAHGYLSTTPFRFVAATNSNDDEFSVLYAAVPLARYEYLRREIEGADGKNAFRDIARVLQELDSYVHFIGVDLASDLASDPGDAKRALAPLEIKRLVQKWIGVSGGYLGDFSYSTHQEFYADLGLPIDPMHYEGTTRSRFMQILEESPPDVQARIVEGILIKYPAGSPAAVDSGAMRSPEMLAEIRGWLSRLRGTAPVDAPVLELTSAVVERALRDAEELLDKNGPTSCVDRVHTALHGYLQQVCKVPGIAVQEDATLPSLLKAIREQHPAFADLGPRADEIMRVLRALGSIVDTLNPLRNHASVAHANEDLLPAPEAMLVVNAVRTILRYLDEKLRRT